MAVFTVKKFMSGATCTSLNRGVPLGESTHTMATRTVTITDDPYLPIREAVAVCLQGEDVLIVAPTQAIARTIVPTQAISIGVPLDDGKKGNVFIRSAEMKSGLKSVSVRNVIFIDPDNIDDQAKSIALSKTCGHQYPNVIYCEV